MAREKAHFLSIVHLRILITLYARTQNISIIPHKIISNNDIKSIGAKLEAKKIIKNNSSNLVRKLTGFPLQKKIEDSEGIEKEKLNILAKLVMEHYKITGTEQIKKNNYLDLFVEKVIIIPQYLIKLNEKKYYKFLTKEEKELVDNYVERKINELIVDSPYIHHYCIYFWNELFRKIETATLQINTKDKTANIKYNHKIKGNWVIKSEQTTDTFHYHNSSTMYLNFIDEDINKKHLRTNLCLSIHESDFTDLKYIKGTYSSSRANADIPVCGIMLLESHNSYSEAHKTATKLNLETNEIEVDPSIEFELMSFHYLIKEENKLINKAAFKTYETYKLISEIKGAYIFGFLYSKNEFEKPDAIILGLCYIEPNGGVISKVKGEDVKGFIINRMHYNDDVFRMINYVNKPTDKAKNNYSLRVVRNSDSVTHLIGVYAGIHDFKPRAGEVFFIKKPEFESYKALCASIKPCLINIENTDSYQNDSDKLELINYLTNKLPNKEYYVLSYSSKVKSNSK